MSDKKIIIGFVGEIASGKDTAVMYLVKKYHASQYKFSGILRDILNRLYLELSRENLQKISQVLRENFSQDILSKVIASDVQADNNAIVIVNGIRRASDIVLSTSLPTCAPATNAWFSAVKTATTRQRRLNSFKKTTRPRLNWKSQLLPNGPAT